MGLKYFETTNSPAGLDLQAAQLRTLLCNNTGNIWGVREVTLEVFRAKEAKRDLLKICGEVVKRLDAAQPVEPGTLLHANLCAAIEGAAG